MKDNSDVIAYGGLEHELPVAFIAANWSSAAETVTNRDRLWLHDADFYFVLSLLEIFLSLLDFALQIINLQLGYLARVSTPDVPSLCLIRYSMYGLPLPVIVRCSSLNLLLN